MATTTGIPAYDPVTFDGPDDKVGRIHRYEGDPGRSNVTGCGITLATDHNVVGPWSTKPLCSGCWA